LMRLQTDHIDLYQFHHVDRTTPWDEIWEAVEVATSQGKIRYAGSSNFAGWHIAQAQETAARRSLMGLVSEQSIYNLLTRDVEVDALPATRAYGLGFLAWAPLHEGILGGRSGGAGHGRRRHTGRAAEAASERSSQLTAFEQLAVTLGHPPGEVALAWVLHQPGVTAPIIGPRNHGQLASAVRAASMTIDQTSLARLDEIFPGHQPAPEEYAR
jgi:aryl-alcohol dehydrogenase-like predicted oxidoreductase